MRCRSKKGSVAVFISVILVSLVFFMSVIFEASAVSAAESTVENILNSVGRSVLSCYDLHLQERYGIFALEMKDTEIEKVIEKSAKLSFEGIAMFDLTCNDVSVEKTAFSMEYPDNIRNQIIELMKSRVVSDSFEGLINNVDLIGEKVKDSDDRSKQISQLEEAKEAAEEAATEANSDDDESNDVNINFFEINNVHNMLKDTAENALESEKKSMEDKVLRNGRIIDTLPSVKNDIKKKSAFSAVNKIFSTVVTGDLSGIKDEFLINEYIMNYFQNHLHSDIQDDTFYGNEVEYVLYGEMSDEDNFEHTRKAIILLRTALNAAYIYGDAEKSAAVIEAAQVLTPGPFAVLTQLLLANAWSAVEAENDMKNLLSGNGVPIIKDDITWMTDLDSIVSGNMNHDYLEIPKGSSMNYGNYLRVLLMTQAVDEKLYRVLDLIQINMKGDSREEFTVSDHYIGLSMDVSYSKKSSSFAIPDMEKNISMTHMYLK